MKISSELISLVAPLATQRASENVANIAIEMMTPD
jgi:hypothetical protein